MTRVFTRLITSIQLLLLTLGCGWTDDPVDSGSAQYGEACDAKAEGELRDCATAYYFAAEAPSLDVPCDPGRPLVGIGQRLELKLFRGWKMSDADVAQNTRALQQYFAPHALRMYTTSLPSGYPLLYALRGTGEEFERALLEAGIDPNASELNGEQQTIATDAVSEVMFRDIREFLSQHARPAGRRVNLLVIQQMVAPELAEYLQLDGTLVGLGLSWALIERQIASDAPSLNSLVNMENDFTPSLFVGQEDVRRLAIRSDAVVAHELGHALGLPHWNEDGNLMEDAGRFDCRRWLTSEQVAMMGPFDARTGAMARRVSSVQNLPKGSELGFRDIPRSVVRQVFRRRSLPVAGQDEPMQGRQPAYPSGDGLQ